MRTFFPLFVDISNKNILVVGAGNIALRRIKTLLEFNIKINVVAPKFIKELRSIKHENLIKKVREFKDEDLTDIDFLLACTDDPKLNEYIVYKAKALGIKVNSCTDKKQCDFYFPSIIKNKDLTVAINSSGKNPSLVKAKRKELEAVIGDNEIKY